MREQEATMFPEFDEIEARTDHRREKLLREAEHERLCARAARAAVPAGLAAWWRRLGFGQIADRPNRPHPPAGTRRVSRRQIA